MMETGSWDELRKRARNLEIEVDMKLVALSKISSGHSNSITHETAPLINNEFSFDTISMEIEDMLLKLSEMNEKMAGLPMSGAAMTHTITRHRDILHGYRQEFNKITQNHSIQLEREELLRGSGILSTSPTSSSLSRRDMYLKEGQHINNSHTMINDQISIAIETQKSLKTQRKHFKRIQNRFNNLANTFPRVNSLLQRINIKKRRDQLAIGGVIVLCTILMLLYSFH